MQKLEEKKHIQGLTFYFREICSLSQHGSDTIIDHDFLWDFTIL